MRLEIARKREKQQNVAPVDGLRDFYLFFSKRAAWGVGGGGGALPYFLFCPLFPVQQTTSGIGHSVK